MGILSKYQTTGRAGRPQLLPLGAATHLKGECGASGVPGAGVADGRKRRSFGEVGVAPADRDDGPAPALGDWAGGRTPKSSARNKWLYACPSSRSPPRDPAAASAKPTGSAHIHEALRYLEL